MGRSMARTWVHPLVFSKRCESRLQLEVGPRVHSDRDYARDGHAIAGPLLDQVELSVVLVGSQVKVVDVLPASFLEGYEPFQRRLPVNVRLTVLVVCGSPNTVFVAYVCVANARVIRRIEIVTTWSLVDAVRAAFEGLGGPHDVDGSPRVCDDVPAAQTMRDESV